MRVIDFIPDVLEALKTGPMNQTTLTEAVWGSSGANNASLVNLLNYMVGKGLITRTQSGRAKWYRLPESVIA